MSVYVFSYFPFGFEGGLWDLLVSVPDHCLSFYLTKRLLNEFAISDGSSVHKSLSVFIDDIVDLFWFPLPAPISWNNLKMLLGFPLFVSTNVS